MVSFPASSPKCEAAVKLSSLPTGDFLGTSDTSPRKVLDEKVRLREAEQHFERHTASRDSAENEGRAFGSKTSVLPAPGSDWEVGAQAPEWAWNVWRHVFLKKILGSLSGAGHMSLQDREGSKETVAASGIKGWLWGWSERREVCPQLPEPSPWAGPLLRTGGFLRRSDLTGR